MPELINQHCTHGQNDESLHVAVQQHKSVLEDNRLSSKTSFNHPLATQRFAQPLTGSASNIPIQRVTDFDIPGDDHSTTEAGIYGTGPAGWALLGMANDDKTKFGWDNSPLDDGEAVYTTTNVLEQSFRGIPLALKRTLIGDYIANVELEPRPSNAAIDAALVNHNVVEALIALGAIGGEQAITQAFATIVKDDATNARLQATSQKVYEIESAMAAEGGNRKAKFESKKGLVDLIQANIKRYYGGQKLIPVLFVIRKEVPSDPSDDFIPNTTNTADKTTAFITDAEIRMVYKLTEEIPDAEVRAVARRSIFFQQQNVSDTGARTFVNIPKPWDDLDTDYTNQSRNANDNFAAGGVNRWQNRTRTNNRAAYGARTAADVPVWVTKLIEYKNDRRDNSILTLREKVGFKGVYEISTTNTHLVIVYTYERQMGGEVVRTKNIPLDTFADHSIEFESDDDQIETNIPTGSGDYLMILSSNDAKTLRRYLLAAGIDEAEIGDVP